MLGSILLSLLAASFAIAAPSMGRLMARSSPIPLTILAGYYDGSVATDSSFRTIKWESYDLVTWAFAVTTPDPSVLSLELSGESLIPTFVQLAKEHSTMSSISIGGWTGSEYFSSAVSPQNRPTFVKAILDMASKYDLDGIDFDWEYPNSLGIGCNEKSSSDSENFLALLQEIRADSHGKDLYLTAAVAVTPFIGPDGEPLTDVSGFAAVLDHVTVMNYDINGQWTTGGVGPNSPLSDSCSTLQTGSATKAVDAWVAAGFPVDKIVLGVPSYGHSFNVTSSNAIDSNGALADHPSFTPAPSSGSVDQCGNVEPVADAITFNDMIIQGYLNTDGTPASGIHYRFDTCSQTPYAYDETKGLMFSYDDATSYAAKGRFITENRLLGFSMWDINGDNDVLVNAITGVMNV